VKDKSRSGRTRGKKLSIADEQYPKVSPKMQQTPDTGREICIWPLSQSINCSLKPHQKWSPWKGGCQEAILKEGKLGEKAWVCQMTQELD